VSSACPADQFLPVGSLCRAAADICDVAETCSGTAAACPADTFVTAGTTCRASAGVCDVAEACTGTAVACPPDLKVAAGTACATDNNPCTTDECDGIMASCQHPNLPDGTSCSDGNLCNGAETCRTGVCTAGAPPNCNDNNPCTADTCVPATGCVHTVLANGTSCSDGNLCNGSETCNAGVCAAGSPLVCDDNNFCTTDLCNPSTGCFHTNVTNGASCSDGNICNGIEACQAGVCVPGTALNCTGTNPCMIDTCDPVAGCRHTAVTNGTSCADGNVCNGFETCQAGFCQIGTAPNCDDGNPCTSDTCDPVAGCRHTNVPDGTTCSDGNTCNGTETCRAGVCTTTGGGGPPPCDDGNPCTVDGCNPTGGCTHTPVADGTVCSNGNVCDGTETCRAGVCNSGTALNCNDGNPCTTDTCDPVAGCQHAVVANGTSCSDGNLCNGTETCTGGVCGGSTNPLNCNDSNPCTIDSCDPVLGCIHQAAPAGTTCSDGNPCNGMETCQGATCVVGTPLSCDDGIACTTDTCDPVTGCQHTPIPNGGSCSDGNPCNGLETCQGGTCLPGSLAPDGTSCSDNNACNGAEICRGGVCQAGTPLNCNDGNPQTIDSCDPILGCTHAIMIAAHKLSLRASLASARMKLSLSGTITLGDAANSGSGDPVLNGGSLRVVSADGFDQEYALPASNWTYIGPPGLNMGYRYRDSALAFGPVRGVAVRDGRTSTIIAAWPPVQMSLAQNPNPVDVELTLGGTQFCMSFGGTTSFVAKVRYGATNAPAPATCAP
jgi:hypothetical protein